MPICRIKACSDSNQTSTVFEKSYFDPSTQISFDSSFFLGHLLTPTLDYSWHIFRNTFPYVTLSETLIRVQRARPEAGGRPGVSPSETIANAKKATSLIRLDHYCENPRQKLGVKVTNVAVVIAPCSQSDANELVPSEQLSAFKVSCSTYMNEHSDCIGPLFS